MTQGGSDATFGGIRMLGGRYAQDGFPLESLPELERYERLIASVAEQLYKARHPLRKRLPRGFRDGFRLRLTAIESGSVVPVLVRSSNQQLLFPVLDDYHDQAHRLIVEALGAVNSNVPLPQGFPSPSLPELARFGSTLRDDEAIELTDGRRAGRLTVSTRRAIAELASLQYIDAETVVLGQVTGLRSEPLAFDLALLDEGRRKITGSFTDPAIWEALRELQGFAERAPLAALTAVARQDRAGSVVTIVDVLAVEPALPPEWAERLAELARLQAGWLPGSEALKRSTLDRVEDFLLSCVDESVPRPGIFPTPEGGIQLEWPGPELVEIEFGPDGQITAFLGEAEYQYTATAELDDLLSGLKGTLNV